jgi:hypothetical protein
MYYYIFKYWFSSSIIIKYFIKTIAQLNPLYALRSYSYYVLKLLPKTNFFWFNSFFFHVISIIDFKFAIPSSFYINNDDNNNIRPSTLKKDFYFILMEFMDKNMKWKSNKKTMIDDTMVFNSTMMTTCMSHFSNPFLNFDSFKALKKFHVIFLQTFRWIKLKTIKITN